MCVTVFITVRCARATRARQSNKRLCDNGRNDGVLQGPLNRRRRDKTFASHVCPSCRAEPLLVCRAVCFSLILSKKQVPYCTGRNINKK